MYYATPYYSASYNKKNNSSTVLPDTVFTGYITRLAFAENERVPYTTLLESDPNYKKALAEAALAGNQEDFMPWEYVMESGDACSADLNRGVVSSVDSHYEDARLHMFAQRSDGSVKPAGQITGGFVESTYDVGSVYINK